MDNKKWYKKIATIFWWVLTILPVLVALIYFIGYHLTFNSGINQATELAEYQTMVNGNFGTYLTNLLQNEFNILSINSLNTMFSNLFNIIGVSDNTTLGILFGYMLSIQLYHLLFDCLVFFIHLIHSFTDTERWCR